MYGGCGDKFGACGISSISSTRTYVMYGGCGGKARVRTHEQTSAIKNANRILGSLTTPDLRGYLDLNNTARQSITITTTPTWLEGTMIVGSSYW